MFTIKLRRDTASRWFKLNPILAEGEPGFETDTGRLKVGDGEQRWRELNYFVPKGGDVDVPVDLEEHINDPTPHPAYDDGPSLSLLYANAKV